MPKHVRVRIAPSPTGLIHIGTIRSVLFNYLMARHYDGTFILRIEDTDRARIHADGVSNILEILEWLDFTPDEGPGLGGDKGPYIQSERLPIYQKWANFLLESGHAYYADLSEDIISAHKQLCQDNKQAFVFRLEDFESSIDTTPKPNTPIRLKVPRKKGSVQWEDMLRGTYETPFNLIEDMVLIKADGYPTYNFANVVDDHLMDITHIIRGDEFLSSSPKHQLLYDLLGFKAPVFMHLPPINGNNGKKLSKREADVSMQSYKEAGFLPEAIINYLAFQGWTPGSDDIYTLDQLIARFDYKKLHKSPAIFDIDKLKWYNGKYIRSMELDQLTSLVKEYCYQAMSDSALDKVAAFEDNTYWERVVSIDRERLETILDFINVGGFFLLRPKVNVELLKDKLEIDLLQSILPKIIDILKSHSFMADALEQDLRSFANVAKINTKDLFYMIRIIITGSKNAPGLFECLHLLGQDEVLIRFSKYQKSLS